MGLTQHAIDQAGFAVVYMDDDGDIRTYLDNVTLRHSEGA